jgi:biopolymer transport protein ExbD
MRGRNKKRNRDVDDNTPVSAMIDIVFLLLIYFITTQKPIIEDTLLPFSPAIRGGASQEEVKTDFMTLEITGKADGYCLMNGQPVLISKLPEWLVNVSKNDPETRIILFCNNKVKHYKLVEVLDICRQSPLKKVSIVAK